MLGRNQLKTIATSIYTYFNEIDKPAADQIVVPVDAIKADTEEFNTYHATVRFVVEYCGKKTHSIRIKFKLDDRGRFARNEWVYV